MKIDKGHMHVTIKVQIKLESSIPLAGKSKVNKKRNNNNNNNFKAIPLMLQTCRYQKSA